MIKVDLSNVLEKIDFDKYQEKVNKINDDINNKTGKGNDYIGWADYPYNYDKEELELIVKSAKEIRDNYDVLVVCGIGGSYLGARAAIEALNGLRKKDSLEIIFMGQTFSSTYIKQTLDYLKDKRFAINVISKSGTTTETSISFRLLKDLLIKQVGREKAYKAIYATTDKEKGALKQESITNKYVTFTLPSDIGGRYSVLTAVGLLPIACSGVNVKKMLKGAQKAHDLYSNPSLKDNPCYQYAITRDVMYRANKPVEMFVTYEPHFIQIGEWLKQLFGESEGKEHKGLFPGSVSFSTDLHSLGQFIQDGSPIMFETILYVNKAKEQITIPHDEFDLDGLNYLEGKSLEFVNEKAFLGTLKAHVEDGKVSNVIISLDEMNEENLGELFYFFERACAMSAYLLEINPFNQPGVEVYKKNMFHLLGKKGY